MDLNIIHNEDCLETLKRLPDGCIDLMIQDLPYNTTACAFEYDMKPFLENLWEQWLRVGKENCCYLFTALEPFRTDLILSNRKLFRYDLVWEKNVGSNFHHAGKMPIKIHEHILVFYRKLPTYNKQYYPAPKYKRHVTKETTGRTVIVKNRTSYEDEIGRRLQKSVYCVGADSDRFNTQGDQQHLHPTQKPIELFRKLIETYSNENEIVFDGFMGSGTTAIASIKSKRNFLGAELDKKYFDGATERINNVMAQTSLF